MKFVSPRDGYKELVEVTLNCINIKPSLGVSIKRAETITKARLISKVIYVLRIFLLSKQNSLKKKIIRL